jgi:hypothetical protein
MTLQILWRLANITFLAPNVVVPPFGRKNVVTLMVMGSFTMV